MHAGRQEEEEESSLSPSSEAGSDSEWYDPAESEGDFEHPKYWSEEDEEVIVGIKQRKAPIKLDTLCGTYRWFYEFPEPGLAEPAYVAYTESAPGPQDPGSLIISCPVGKRATLKNIAGTVVHFGKEAQFSGIKRAKDQAKNLLNNQWEFGSLKWKEDYGDNQEHGNCLIALDVSDEDGDPFVMFRYASPAAVGGHTSYLDIAAKKERGTDKYGLSKAEMARLGMDSHYPDVRAAAQVRLADAPDEEESESGTDDEVPVEKSRSKRKPESTASFELDLRPRKRKAA
ncbi:hypothetical protein B0H15DRAFT_846183 [Mycena belliarum]|uniref:Uncharacterized protein n=1 Tax=Mycena belliarum TaxID=1033014 RepID=A0AAD6U0H7_9AGAR|nr:hypothetical protein B0H15DRAFT_846183 [Mycena belliae]